MSDLFAQETETTQVTLVPEAFARHEEFLSLGGKAKELGKQIDWVFTQRKTEYLSQVLLLQRHKSVAIRRKIADGLGKIAGKEILEQIKQWQDLESDRQTWLILETLSDKLERGLETSRQSDIKVLTVTEALTYIKKLLGEGTYTIEGELVEVRPFRNMYYFAIKDKQEGRLNCWAFERIVQRIDFPLNDGLSVRLTGKFKLSKDSRLYLDTQYIQLTGEGELLRNLKLLEEKLRQEGLFDEARKRLIPPIPQNILLIASPNSAALTDFTKVLGQRRTGINIHFLPIKTQGAGAEALILEQLARANHLTQELGIDTVVLTRGGGSQDDLFVFNSERVVRALHGLNRPTIVAIGHERDTTLAELVADLRCATPSQAAEGASLSSQEIIYQTESRFNFIKNYVQEKKYQYRHYINQVLVVIQNLIRLETQNAKNTCARTGQIAGSIIHQARFEAQNCWRYSLQNTQSRLQEAERQADRCWSLAQQKVRLDYNRMSDELKLVASQIFLHDPHNILQKGYALILQEGRVREKLSDLAKQKPLTIRMQDGELEYPQKP
jgi:exodeoxyribonuclease VII large subunit